MMHIYSVEFIVTLMSDYQEVFTQKFHESAGFLAQTPQEYAREIVTEGFQIDNLFYSPAYIKYVQWFIKDDKEKR